LDGLSDVGVEVVNPGSKEGAVDTKIKALLLKIIHNESHRPGPADQIEIIVLLSADRDYSPEIQALRRFSRFRVITFHSGNSKDYMMDETMVDAASTRWDSIVAGATEGPAIEAKPAPTAPLSNTAKQLDKEHSAAVPPMEVKSEGSKAALATAPPVPCAAAQPNTKDAGTARGTCSVITNIVSDPRVLEQRMNRFQSQGSNDSILGVPPRNHYPAAGAPEVNLAAQMAHLSIRPAVQDALLYCVSCQRDFVWPVAEQALFRQRGLYHEPRLCRDCRVQPGPGQGWR
jgi:hypothetical protein